MVLDASALIDSVRDDHPDWGEAVEHLLSTYPAMAPALLASEVGNVVHRLRPREFADAAEDRAELRESLLAGIALHPPIRAHRDQAGVLVESHRLSFYDAEYLAAALGVDDALLVTHDGDLLKAAQRKLPAGRALDLDGVVRAIRAGDL